MTFANYKQLKKKVWDSPTAKKANTFMGIGILMLLLGLGFDIFLFSVISFVCFFIMIIFSVKNIQEYYN